MNGCREKYPSLHWGISTLGCPDADLAQAAALADRNGIEYLEIRTVSGENDVAKTLRVPENRPTAVRLTESGRVRVLDSSFRIASTDLAAHDALLDVARTADEFNIPYIRLFGGFSGELTGDILRQCMDNIMWFKSFGFRTRLALETHDGFSWSDRVVKLMELCGEELPVIWDAHHTFQVGKEPFAESLRLLKPFLVTIHFKDSHWDIAAEGGPQFIHDLPGAGEVPLTELFELLEQEKITVPVVLEYEKLWRQYLPELSEALTAWQNLCR